MNQYPTDQPFKVLLLYWSATGNTEKVADAIRNSLGTHNTETKTRKITESLDEDLFDYDLVFIGTPSYQFQPPEQVQRFVKKKMKYYSEIGKIKPCAPRIRGKLAVIFCTYSGPHTGVGEAMPVGEYLGQFFEHLGFEVAAKWYIVGEFHGREDLSTSGRLGDIRGCPNPNDLAEVEKNVHRIFESMGSKR
jgi:flavodoxin